MNTNVSHRLLLSITSISTMCALSACSLNPVKAAGGASAFPSGSPINPPQLTSLAPTTCSIQNGEFGRVDTVTCRNYIIGEWLTQSESLCTDYIAGLTKDSSGWNLGLGWGGTLLSGLATAFTHTETVKAFAAAGAIFTGAKNEYDADILAKKTIDAIAGAIQSHRYSIRVFIESNMTPTAKSDGTMPSDADELSRYPLSVAAADVQRFHQACSLSAGLAAISSNSADAKAGTDQAVAASAGTGKASGSGAQPAHSTVRNNAAKKVKSTLDAVGKKASNGHLNPGDVASLLAQLSSAKDSPYLADLTLQDQATADKLKQVLTTTSRTLAAPGVSAADVKQAAENGSSEAASVIQDVPQTPAALPAASEPLSTPSVVSRMLSSGKILVPR